MRQAPKHVPSNPGLPSRPDPAAALAALDAECGPLDDTARRWASEIRRARDLELRAGALHRLSPGFTLGSR